MRKYKKTFESNDERSEMINKLCSMGYEKEVCDAMSYEELCDCMEKEMANEESWDSEGEKMEEGIFQKGLEALGIKGMARRVEDLLGVSEEGFEPTKNAKLYIEQGFSREQIPTNDIKKIGEALMKAKKVGFGVSSWKDKCDLTKMEGSDEEKKTAAYLINRAIYSIHSTAGGGHDFGKAPDISGLRDSKSYSKFKHLKSFESFKNK